MGNGRRVYVGSENRYDYLDCGCRVTLVCQLCCHNGVCVDPISHIDQGFWEQRCTARTHRCDFHKDRVLPLRYVLPGLTREDVLEMRRSHDDVQEELNLLLVSGVRIYR